MPRMVTHPWYVIHIPGTNAYMPIWTVAILLLTLVTIASAVIFVVGWVSSPPRKNP
jgi:hypothetical protein